MKLAGGNATAQLLTIALVPVITRIYPPEAYGQFATVAALITFITSVSSLRYSAAILIPKDEIVSAALLWVGLSAVFAISCLCLLFVAMGNGVLGSLLGLGEHSVILYLVPTGVFLAGVKLVLDPWYLRGKLFGRLAVSQISGAATDRASVIALGLGASASAGNLLIGRQIGQTVEMVSLLTVKRCRPTQFLKTRNRIGAMSSAALEYRRFPKYAWSSLVQQGTTQIPVPMLAAFFGPAIAGFFALARRMLLQPVYVLGDALARTFFEKVSADFRAGRELGPNTLKLVQGLLSLFLPPIAIVAVYAPELFSTIFGARWMQAGYFVRWLAPMFLTVLVLRPLSIFFDLFQKQRELAIFNLVSLIGMAAALTVGGLYGSADAAIGLYVAVGFLVVVVRALWLFQQAGVAISDATHMVAREIIRGAIVIAPLVMLRAYHPSQGSVDVAIVVVGIGLYFLYWLRFIPYGRDLTKWWRNRKG
ncbi:MAG: lipopolysaccharide biosynthesis protein [Gammaproteobacteria bacterium]